MTQPKQSIRDRIHEIIFEADTPAGKAFDVILLIAILGSVLSVMLESVDWINQRYTTFFKYSEWVLTMLFLGEYILRIYSVKRPWNYIFSFFGLVDLLSILPTFISVLVPGTQYLITIRAIRLLRIFRILKLSNYLRESQTLLVALRASRTKITVFLFAVLTSTIIIGSTMYLVEGGQPDTGFTSIPRGVYWAIVTLTTVGYGDIAPETPLGQFLSAILMIMGYGVIAVPTGIVSVELAQAENHEEPINTTSCSNCSRSGHDNDAKHCKYCGAEL